MTTGSRVDIPGLEIAVLGDAARLGINRLGPNRWAVATLVDEPHRRRAVTTDGALPSGILTGLGRTAAGCLLHIEHDVCGTWVTLANTRAPRPVVVRRAAWIDLRGHDTPLDDRVGLGPGDALVVLDAEEATIVNEVAPAALLDAAGSGVQTLVDRCCSAADDAGARLSFVAAIAVPPELGEDPLQRVVEATGTPPEELVLPGYPLGDLQPDLWERPPAPPRDARLRLPPDAARVRGVRNLIDRLIASWRIDGAVDEGDVAVLATELAANAVVHAGTDATVVVRFLGDRLLVAVDDSSAAWPEMRTPSADRSGGRGLLMVEALASAWGVDRRATGKRVWFEVPVQIDAPPSPPPAAPR